jgi:hypothetical protein
MITYTLILFIGKTRIFIPNFKTENLACMAGQFLQLANEKIALFETTKDM